MLNPKLVRSYYKSRFEKRYHLNVRFSSSMAHFFGLGPDEYDIAISKMMSKSIIETLRSDVQAIGQDMHKVLREHELSK